MCEGRASKIVKGTDQAGSKGGENSHSMMLSQGFLGHNIQTGSGRRWGSNPVYAQGFVYTRDKLGTLYLKDNSKTQ